MKTKSLNKKRGISLIVLVITIIVIIILAVAVILSIANNNPIENANKAKFQNDVKSMQEELELIKQNNYVNNKGQGYGTLKFDELTGHEKYDEKFDIKEGKLVYTSELNGNELIWAKELGISSNADVLENGKYDVDIKTNENGKVELSTRWSDAGKAPDGISAEIEVPEGVQILKGGAFRGSENSITKITLPSTLEIIESGVFTNCSGLTEILIPGSVTEIGNMAFTGCTKLKKVLLPNGLEKIESGLFCYCSSLTSITIPSSVISIDEYAFGGCSALTNIAIPNSVTSIGNAVFENCSNLTVTISESTAKACFGDTATEDSVKTTLGVKAVVFK